MKEVRRTRTLEEAFGGYMALPEERFEQYLNLVRFSGKEKLCPNFEVDGEVLTKWDGVGRGECFKKNWLVAPRIDLKDMVVITNAQTTSAGPYPTTSRKVLLIRLSCPLGLVRPKEPYYRRGI